MNSPGSWSVAGYVLRAGSSFDRALLLKFMQLTYQELYPGSNFAHLSQTVDHYLSPETPLWWVDLNPGIEAEASPIFHAPIACLWLGSAIDQIQGDRQTYIFLLYVDPQHRRHGIGTALMQLAESWATARGDRQIGLQVFHQNQAALRLYDQLGYQPQSLWLVKPLQDVD